MNRFLKTLLIWLLIAVVPLNAVAATVGMSCGPIHQQGIKLVNSQAAGHAMHGNDGDHHAMAHGTGPMHGSATAGANTDSGNDESLHSSCSACSVFCVGAVAPPSVFAPLPAFSGSENVVILAAPPVSRFIPEGLRRPPRARSA